MIAGAGFTPAIVARATLDAAVATFRIVKSKIAADSGGLWITKAGTTTGATGFDIKLSASPTLAATVNGALLEADILNLDLWPEVDGGRPDCDAGRRRRTVVDTAGIR